MSTQYTIGLDYGTNSVRALVVNVANGREVATAVWGYAHGTQGVILSRDPNLARQHPADYLKGAGIAIKQALAAAKKNVRGFKATQVLGIGVDTTVRGDRVLPLLLALQLPLPVIELAAVETVGVEVDGDRVTVAKECDRAAEEGLR